MEEKLLDNSSKMCLSFTRRLVSNIGNFLFYLKHTYSVHIAKQHCLVQPTHHHQSLLPRLDAGGCLDDK